MANIKVRDLTDTTTITSDNQIMVLTNDPINLVQNITVGNFNQNIISTDADNGIEQGSDGGLYVDNADSGVTAGTYQYPQNLVVNEKGQITSVESGSPAAVPIATTSQAGIVKPDGSTITVLSDGTISAAAAASRNIGEIVASTIPLTDAGLHLLDGTVLSGSGIYSAFVDYIADIYDASANYFCTEAEWQQSVTDYGVCGKFVYDSVNNTVRLPLYNSKIYTGGGTAPVIGNGNCIGYTDGVQTGSPYYNSTYGVGIRDSGVDNPVGIAASGTVSPVSFADKCFGLSTDSTKSGIIVQLSGITTSLDGYYYIVIATSTKTDIQVDIDEIATDLNMKVDKSSLVEAHVVVETYSNGSSWYRVYDDGWCEQGGQTAEGTSIVVSLLKAYINTNYNVQITCVNKSPSDQNWTCSAKTTNSFTYSNSESYAVDWRACGYIA